VDCAIDCCKKKRWNYKMESDGGRVADGCTRRKCPCCFHFYYSLKKSRSDSYSSKMKTMKKKKTGRRRRR
jgi:hypothetical protein